MGTPPRKAGAIGALPPTPTPELTGEAAEYLESWPGGRLPPVLREAPFWEGGV